MRVSVTALAAGASPWAVLDWEQSPFNCSLFAALAFGTTLTYKVQSTPDKPNRPPTQVSLTRAGTVATVTHTAHGLATGDATVIMGSGDPNLDGQQPTITVVDANTYTYPVVNTGATVGAPATKDITMRVFDHDTMTGLSARADGNYLFPVQACRLFVTAYTSGSVELTATQAHGKT